MLYAVFYIIFGFALADANRPKSEDRFSPRIEVEKMYYEHKKFPQPTGFVQRIFGSSKLPKLSPKGLATICQRVYSYEYFKTEGIQFDDSKQKVDNWETKTVVLELYKPVEGIAAGNNRIEFEEEVVECPYSVEGKVFPLEKRYISEGISADSVFALAEPNYEGVNRKRGELVVRHHITNVVK